MVALFDRNHRFHAHFRSHVVDTPAAPQLHTTWPCVTEATDLLNPGERLALLKWIGKGALQVSTFDAPELLQMCRWIQQYTQPPRTTMDLADASLYWLANASGITRIFTMDVRDFLRYRLPGGRAFEIL